MQCERAKSLKSRFIKALSFPHHPTPYAIATDQNLAYSPAVEQLKIEKIVSKSYKHRKKKYLNNIEEQDDQFIKRKMRLMLGSKSFRTIYPLVSR
ncbi:DDE-type integrase/transposase/recombinase [Polycladospora coralii]|uniref:DDE-type integrase/transposase/recombinase n=1 Tax=Polycladospora coralii TaxID=2771432 RepID=UPI003D3002E1